MRHYTGKKDLCNGICHLAVVVAFVMPIIAGPLAAQDVLSRVKDDNLLYVPFDGRPSAGPVFAEIDGIRQPLPARIVGSYYVVEVPEDLRGNRHDLRLIVESPRTSEDLGWWLFETSSNRSLTFGSVLSEIGVRTKQGKADTFANGVIRLEFDRNEGQQSGRLVVSRVDNSGVDGEDEFDVGDVFLETGFPIFGQDAFARIGNADVGADTVLQDAASRRGLTFGLDSPTGGRSFSAFILTPDAAPGLDNFLGLSDRNNLIYGLSATLTPSHYNGLKFDVATYQGRTHALPDGETGDISARAMAVVFPIANTRGDLSFGLASSNWQSDGLSKSNSAIAREIRAAWQLSEEDAYQQNEVSFAYEQIDQDFFSPLNPGLIAGEERISAAFASISPAWQLALTLETAKTNYKGSALAPTDQLSSVSFSLLHDPGDFTGGFLNGTTFYLNAGVDQQERLTTPVGAAASQDNRLAHLSFGINKVQPKAFWGARLAFDDLVFDANTAPDERKLFGEARLDISPSPLFSAQFFARAGGREIGVERFKEAEASIVLVRNSVDGLWETSLEGSYLVSNDPSMDDGRSAVLTAARDVGNNVQIVGEMTWGSGRYAPVGTTHEGVSIGLFLRTDLGFSNE